MLNSVVISKRKFSWRWLTYCGTSLLLELLLVPCTWIRASAWSDATDSDRFSDSQSTGHWKCRHNSCKLLCTVFNSVTTVSRSCSVDMRARPRCRLFFRGGTAGGIVRSELLTGDFVRTISLVITWAPTGDGTVRPTGWTSRSFVRMSEDPISLREANWLHATRNCF